MMRGEVSVAATVVDLTAKSVERKTFSMFVTKEFSTDKKKKGA